MTLSLDTFIFIITSYARGNNGVLPYLLKVDPQTLDTIWTRTYTHPDTAASLQSGAEIYNAFTAIKQTYDGGFIISGMYNPNCDPNAQRKAYLLKVDSIGDVEWIKKYPQIGSLFDIELASDSGFYFPAVYNNTIRAVKADKFGNIQWTVLVNSKQYPHVPLDLEILDSNYLYVSSSHTYDATYFKHAVVLSKVNINTQSKIWEKTYILFNSFECHSLHQTMGLDILPTGDLIISGSSLMANPQNANEINYKGVIMKLDSNGNRIWDRWHGHGLFVDDCNINDIVLTDDGGFLAAGWQWHNNGALFFQNAWLLKMDSMGCDTANCHIYDAINESPIPPNLNMKIYPNPASDYFRVNVDGIENLNNLNIFIYDMQGRLLRKIEFNSSLDQLIGTDDLLPGIYNVSLYSNNLLLENQRLTIIK
jgi:hypothetical protein